MLFTSMTYHPFIYSSRNCFTSHSRHPTKDVQGDAAASDASNTHRRRRLDLHDIFDRSDPAPTLESGVEVLLGRVVRP